MTTQMNVGIGGGHHQGFKPPHDWPVAKAGHLQWDDGSEMAAA
jgi:hypothetical protein